MDEEQCDRSYSLKGRQFQEFSKKVVEHIEDYVVPQYGDHPDEMLKNLTAGQVQFQLQKYARRIFSSSREGESVRDSLKIAHYACYLHSLLTTGGPDG